MAKTGRPPKEFDWQNLDAYCSRKMSLADCSELLKVSEDTIQRRIKKKFKLTFAEYRDKKMAHTRINLTEKAIGMALDGDKTMLIFCLKNICGWVDRLNDNVDNEDANITINYTIPKE